MIYINKDEMTVDGNAHIITTEVACLLSAIREHTPEVMPVIYACLYSDGGKNKLTKSLELFKEDTTATLKALADVEAKK